MICGKKLLEAGSAQAAEFKSIIREALQLAGLPNLSDIFHFLERFDLQGLNRIDTTSATIEWTVTELLRKPALMKKAQEELDDVVGVLRRMEEADIANLP
ncbi:hypothetical protein SUGI_0348590 [Cryptomeria japonica]|nr:hypothetical protein SUGI_0348590 [Cryptomeria japonica]